MGYDGVRNAMLAQVPPMVTDGVPGNGFLVYHSYVGFGSATVYPGGYAAPPNNLHPCVGGPGTLSNQQVPYAGTYSQPDDYLVAPPAGYGSELDATLRQVFHFRRYVEIFGGHNYVPFPYPGAPQTDCYLIRVTITTQGNVGTMVRPTDYYQVVTVVGRH